MHERSHAPRGLDRRGLLRAVAVTGAAAAGAATAAGTTTGPAAAASRNGSKAGVSMRWLGVSGWEIVVDGRVLYFDPYLSRFDYVSNGGRLEPNPTVVDNLRSTGRLAGPPELVMVSHGHWDHLGDVPQLLDRPEWADATIKTIGTDTHRHLLAAMGVSQKRMGNVITATGGEELVFADGAYEVRVVRSLHSQSKGHGYFAPGVRVTPPPVPTLITDLVEGGTLAYQVTVPDRLSMLLFGGTNFVERELVGLRPDVVAVCLTDHSSLPRYLERLLTVLGGPRYAIPVHHDDMITGFDAPHLPDTVNRTAVEDLKKTVRTLRLPTQVIEPVHLEPLRF